ncbi:alpha/beta hydrolase [Kutzneria kofuensis]|uniref:Acetyl esterase/lipase n=1 Tax=Kutzneria kofuensis TaxID=103725 RepID=A0A7W9NEC4_9PSEU|nr:alpha/beta hydrolase [Kutzneria kofuensis]MBB5888981.1 acetyl esterase/lipase [Kutzneria kofuensis]
MIELSRTLDLYPAPDPDAPLVLYIHGGGWQHGDKADDAANRLAPMAALGVNVASVNYRLAPGTTFPGPVHDVKGAVRWLRANGEKFGLRTEKIGVWGASAGAYLGSLLALTPGRFEGEGNLDRSSAVQAAVHWFGQADLAVSASRSAIEARLLPFAFEQAFLGGDTAKAADLSLLRHVSPQAPPFLISHGDRDRIIPPSESQALHDALSRSGVDSRFLLLGGAGHEDPAFDSPASLAMTAAWLRTMLG